VRARAPHAAPRKAAAAAFALSFAALVRPDYVLLVAPSLASLCVLARGWRRFALAALGVSSALAYHSFRMGYFASAVPNTALAKRVFELSGRQGWHYLWNTLGVYWLLVPLAVVALAFAWERRSFARDWRSTPSCLIAGGLLHIAYIVGMGGDFMHARLLLPGMFVLFSAVPLLALEPGERGSRRGAVVLAAVVLYGWCAVCSLQLRVATKNEFGIGDERGWYARMAKVAHPTRIEHYAQFAFYREALELRDRIQARCSADQCVRLLFTRKEDGKLRDHSRAAELPLADDVSKYALAAAAYRPLGIVSAVLGTRVHVVDYYGLADPIAARLTVVHQYRPGHDKAFDTAWQAARYASPDSTDDPRALAAANALSCGVLGQLNRATRGPLSVGRFLQNLALALRTSQLQIPADPFEAENEFCAP
jgi:arabinofuranosyltransferase